MRLLKTEYYELPTKYNNTIVRLLVQSPTRMYVYWDISEESIKNFESHKNDYSSSTPVLRIINKTMNYSYDIQIDPFTNNYYIETKDSDCEYQVELGRISKDTFINLYTSNTAKVPRNAPMPFDESQEIIYRNYIRMDVSDKFTLYRNRADGKNSNYRYNIDGKHPQDYSALDFSSEENGISSMENVSSFTRYQE